MRHGSTLPPINGRRDIANNLKLSNRSPDERTYDVIDSGNRETQPRCLELVVGKISEGIEREGVRRIAQIVVLGNEDKVVFKHSEPVLLFLLGRVGFAMLITPRGEEIGGEGWRR